MAQVGWTYNGHLIQLGLGEHHIAAEVGGEHICVESSIKVTKKRHT